MRILLPLILTTALLQACTMVVPQPAPAPGPAPQSDLTSCHAVGLQGLIGAPVALLPADGGWTVVRVIRPGQMVTMDFSATRLNVTVDGADIIQSLTCG